MVCEITGNTSEAVQAYKRTSNVMQESLSNVMYGNKGLTEQKKSESTDNPKKLCSSTVSRDQNDMDSADCVIQE